MWQATAIFGGLLLLVSWLYVGKIEEAAKLDIANQVLVATAELDKQVADLNQQLVDTQGEHALELAKLATTHTNALSKLERNIEDRYKTEPFQAANDVESRLALFTCLYGSGNDRSKRENCNARAALPYSPEFSATVAITPAIAERWEELCDDTGEHCDYTIVGLRKDFFFEFQAFLDAVDRDQLALRDRLDDERQWRKKKSELEAPK